MENQNIDINKTFDVDIKAFEQYKNVKNPMAIYLNNVKEDTAEYLNNQLLLKYSQKQIKTYLEIDAYVKRLIEGINAVFEEE